VNPTPRGAAVLLTIGRLAAAAGVTTDTVRFYERAGLLPHVARTAGGYRLYADKDVERLRFIRRAKAFGFTLKEIRSLLDLTEQREPHNDIRALAVRRLAQVEQHLAEIAQMRDALRALVDADGSGTESPLATHPNRAGRST